MNYFAGLMEPMRDRPCIDRHEPKREITPKPRPTPRAIPASPWGLTELQLLMQALSAEGLSRKEIGARMGISIKTIDVHLRLGKKKMGARNNVHAAVLYDRWARENKAEGFLFDGTAPGGDLQVSGV